MNDKEYMALAIQEANKAKGHQLPNPKVGAILVNGDKIIGQGHHSVYGENHAEINAIENVSDANKHLIAGSKLYVTLQPCSSKGKTQSCVHYIKKTGITELVYGSKDSSQTESNNVLKDIDIRSGVLLKETDYIIKNFQKNINENNIYIALKVAMTLDGYIATPTNESKWITNEEMRIFTRQRRSNFQAILIGDQTLLLDNPKLTSTPGHKNPDIVVISPDYKIKEDQNIFESSGRKIIFTKSDITSNREDLIIIKFTGDLKISFIENQLWKLGIKSLLVEGGSYTINTFLSQRKFDTLEVYIGEQLFGDTKSKNAFNFQSINSMNESLKLKLVMTKTINGNIFLEYEAK